MLIGGPCVIESEQLVIEVGEGLKAICAGLGLPFIFKTSFDKANRSSHDSFRGPGLEKGIEILSRAKERLEIPFLVDVHTAEQVPAVARVADVVQIPAFLCRQTDLIKAACESGRVVNVKKGQFLAPWDARNIVRKCEAFGARGILLTERGTSFGYNNLVADMRSLPIMRGFGYPVVFDATHSLQLPGGLGSSTGGQREFAPHLMRAAVAAGCDGLFIEVHPQPDRALSDGPNQLPLEGLSEILARCMAIDRIVKGRGANR